MYSVFAKLLEQRGLTMTDVSRGTGINQSTFSNWKKRNNLISGKNARLIADFFSIPVDYLMTGDPKYLYYAYAEEVEPTLTLEETKIINAYRKADDIDKQMILRILHLELGSDSESLREA